MKESEYNEAKTFLVDLKREPKAFDDDALRNARNTVDCLRYKSNDTLSQAVYLEVAHAITCELVQRQLDRMK